MLGLAPAHVVATDLVGEILKAMDLPPTGVAGQHETT